MSKMSVALDEQELAELEMILIDKDKAAALRFLKEVVWAQVQTVRRKRLRSHLDTSQR